MDPNRCLNSAAAMASKAKNGTLIVDGQRYTLTFDHSRWLYIVTNAAGTEVTNFNTKSLKVAREWLREWLAN